MQVIKYKILSVKLSAVVLFLVLLTGTVLAQFNQAQLEFIYRSARDYERLGYYEKSAQQYQVLFENQPTNTSYYRGLKRNLERLGRYDKVVQVVRRRLLVADDAMGRSDLGSALYATGQTQQAFAEWYGVIDRNPTSASGYSQVATAMLSNQLYDEAIVVYYNGRKAMRSDKLFAIEIANAYAARNKYAKATAEFLVYVDSNPRQLPYVQRRILKFIDAGDGEKILKVIEKRVQNSEHPKRELLSLYSSCLTRLDRYPEALQIQIQLEENRREANGRRKQGSDLYNFASDALKDGKTRVAIQAFSLLLSEWPNSAYAQPAKIGLSDAYLQIQDYASAVRVLDEVAANSPQGTYRLKAQLAKGKILLENLHEPGQAIAVYKEIFDEVPNSSIKREAAVFVGDGYLQLGQTQKAEAWYDKALQLISKNQTGLLNKIHFRLAELAFCAKEFTKSITLFEKVEFTGGKMSDEGDLGNDALEWIFFIEEAQADSAGALSEYADFKRLSIQKKDRQALAVLEKIVQSYPSSPVAARALLDAGGIYLRLQKPEGAFTAYERILQDYPTSVYVDAALFQLAGAYAETGRPGEAIASYEKLLVDFPDSIYLEEARKRLRQLREKAPQAFQQ